jgi:hypothetical protein
MGSEKLPNWTPGPLKRDYSQYVGTTDSILYMDPVSLVLSCLHIRTTVLIPR